MVDEAQNFLKNFEGELTETWVVFTKADRLASMEGKDFQGFYDKLKALIPKLEKMFIISAKEDKGVDELVDTLCTKAVSGPHMYPDGAVSNKNMRFFASEYIREQAFAALKDELPYEMAVVIEQFLDAKKVDGKKTDTQISASILVNRPSQRGIVV